MQKLLAEIKNCTICSSSLVHGVNPVVQLSEESRILIVGQAPGKRVHETGIPWNDRSGDTLRSWLDVTKDQFYNPQQFAIMPMGFCYPGKGTSGDLPPRKECAKLWHPQVLDKIEQSVELVLLIGLYAQQYYLTNAKANLTENIKHFEEFLPKYFVLPHPSPRNIGWHKNNPWFNLEVLPVLRHRVKDILSKE